MWQKKESVGVDLYTDIDSAYPKINKLYNDEATSYLDS
jgi:hypothetical protein